MKIDELIIKYTTENKAINDGEKGSSIPAVQKRLLYDLTMHLDKTIYEKATKISNMTNAFIDVHNQPSFKASTESKQYSMLADCAENQIKKLNADDQHNKEKHLLHQIEQADYNQLNIDNVLNKAIPNNLRQFDKPKPKIGFNIEGILHEYAVKELRTQQFECVLNYIESQGLAEQTYLAFKDIQEYINATLHELFESHKRIFLKAAQSAEQHGICLGEKESEEILNGSTVESKDATNVDKEQPLILLSKELIDEPIILNTLKLRCLALLPSAMEAWITSALLLGIQGTKDNENEIKSSFNTLYYYNNLKLDMTNKQTEFFSTKKENLIDCDKCLDVLNQNSSVTSLTALKSINVVLNSIISMTKENAQKSMALHKQFDNIFNPKGNK